MNAYQLRRIDPELWKRVQARAEDEGITVRGVILKLLELYAAGDIAIRAQRRDA